ncbi:hypothetical protein Patl1_17965 [Pistacia atlantica]|uniref:Uncharacterized protein n=1 Tax=Pistacia atlantica TaxID=434234 RepID=A0ACC1BYQ7_9ROSI|nr:hypothetical protein Patl1_17965 [Pistacia atlantica]
MGIMPCHSNCDCQSHSARFQSDLSYTVPYLSAKSPLSSFPHLTNPPEIKQCFHHPLSLPHHSKRTTIPMYPPSPFLGNSYTWASSDREIRSWDCNPLTSQLDQDIINNNKVAVGKGAVKSLVVLADKLFSAHQDHKIRVWKINNQEHDHQQKYTRLATLPTLGDRAFKLLMPKNHVQIRRHKTSTWVHHVDTVSALALTTDGTLLYSVSWDRTIKIWRTSDFKCLESITNAHDDAINAVALSDDGHVYTGSADKKIKVWRKNNGEKKHSLVSTLEKHKSGINALALSTGRFCIVLRCM